MNGPPIEFILAESEHRATLKAIADGSELTRSDQVMAALNGIDMMALGLLQPQADTRAASDWLILVTAWLRKNYQP